MVRVFNPHLPCGRWQWVTVPGIHLAYFNPHLPCGRWRIERCYFSWSSNFNPHLPCGRWPTALSSRVFLLSISIHTFLAEGDIWAETNACNWCDFNPHLPCGRWHFLSEKGNALFLFQSTPSLRKVTFPTLHYRNAYKISIHTFLAEGDDKIAHR